MMAVDTEVRRAPDAHVGRVAFTGYRPQKMPFGFDETDVRCIDFKRRLAGTIEELIRQRYQHFLSGGAMGMDMFAAEAVLQLKDKYPNITLEMVSPFDGQATRWAPEYRHRHQWLFDRADVITFTGHEYHRAALFIRNQYMVDHADLLLAAYDGQSGGTRMTVEYARRKNIQIMLIQPEIRSDDCGKAFSANILREQDGSGRWTEENRSSKYQMKRRVEKERSR